MQSDQSLTHVMASNQFRTSVNEGSNERGQAQESVEEERRTGVFFPVTDE